MLSITGVFLTGLANGYGQCGLSCMSQVGPYLVAQGQPPGKSMGLAARYLVGKTLAYAVLGSVAAVVGQGLDVHLEGFARYFMVAALFIAAAFAIKPPKAKCAGPQQDGRQKKGGFLLWGIASSFVPCPTLLGLFAFAAQTNDPYQGFLLGLVYGSALFFSPVLWASSFAGGIGFRLAELQSKVLPLLRIGAAMVLVLSGVQLLLWED